MKISHDFKRELMKAMKLSAFITVLVFGMLIFGAARLLDQRGSRSIASDPAESTGIHEQTSGRSVPPFERKTQ